ncbi:RNA polymerase Rpc34 [Syncephalis fuscata]|nr:RNA polymerase Rpc34 [Syncephalis fuscata]
MATSHVDTLYRFIQQHPDGIPTKDVDTAMGQIPDMQRVEAINLMIRRGMIQLLQHQDSFAYKAVQLDTMSKMANLNGIWTKTIKIRTNLHQQVVARCIKTLEQKNLIKSVKSVKNPTRKLYMLIELTPSTEVTGGPWFTDQEWIQCYKYIYSRSFPRQPPDAIYPSNYSGYPSVREIAKFIADRQISNVALGMDDIECLLDVLVLDGKIEKVSSHAIRDRQVTGNPWTNTPCGKCPIFSFCTEDGPISPNNCDYYTRWLQY